MQLENDVRTLSHNRIHSMLLDDWDDLTAPQRLDLVKQAQKAAGVPSLHLYQHEPFKGEPEPVADDASQEVASSATGSGLTGANLDQERLGVTRSTT